MVPPPGFRLRESGEVRLGNPPLARESPSVAEMYLNGYIKHSKRDDDKIHSGECILFLC